jgi:hypothetical protein
MYWPQWVKFGKQYAHWMPVNILWVLSKLEQRTPEMNFSPHFPHLLSDLGEIWYYRPTHNAVQWLVSFVQTWHRKGHTLLMDVNEITCTRDWHVSSAIPCDVSKVKNALSFVYAKACTISGIFLLTVAASVLFYMASQWQIKFRGWIKHINLNSFQCQIFTIHALESFRRIFSITDIPVAECVFFSHGTTTPSGPDRPHYRGFTITLSYTPYTVGLLWMNDQPDAETSTCHHTTLTGDTHSWLRRESNLQSQ